MEDKLSSAVDDRRKMLDLETELDEARLKIAQLEIAQESLKKKCEDATRERDACKTKISKLLENRSQSNGVEKNLEDRVKLLENELRRNEEKLVRLKDIDLLKEERDRLVAKLKDQAIQFERYVKSQTQVSAELNGSPRSSTGEADLQRIKEIAIKEVREEMEEKVTDELKGIEEQHRQRQKDIEEKYKSLLIELQTRCREKSEELDAVREAMIAERLELQSSFKMQEQAIAKMLEAKLEKMHHELVARKLRIEALQDEFKKREIDMEEERNAMAQVMSEWAAEIRSIKAKEAEMNNEIDKLKQREEELIKEINEFQAKENQMQNYIDLLKHKYKTAKKTAQNYKVGV